MRRKVSLWIVIVLVGALAATTAAAVILAQRDDGPNGPGAGGLAASGWSHPGVEEGGEWQGPAMGSFAAWEREGATPVLPWILFALATGTAVGLLVAWSPWRAQPATVTAGPPDQGGDFAAREGATQTTAVDHIVIEHASVSEQVAAGESVAEGFAVEDTAQPEDDRRSDEAAEAGENDDATLETPPKA